MGPRATQTMTSVGWWVLILAALLATRAYNYLLFHSLAELFSVVIAACIFTLAWNSRSLADNHYLIFLGIGYLFVSLLDGVHTLAYKGMGVFPGYDANLPTQLWIAARALESLSLLLAPLFIKRRLRIGLAILGYTLVTALILSTIFIWQIFPACFLEPGGLTRFKIASEYFIVAILLAALLCLYRHRSDVSPEVSGWSAGPLSLPSPRNCVSPSTGMSTISLT